jgi:hypothetical protein
MPRIRNWKDLTLFRPSKDSQYQHIDGLFTDTIDWKIIEDDDNLVVTQAEALTADMLIGTAASFINYIEFGNPSPAQAPLITNVALQQTTGVNKVVSRTRTGNVAAFEATLLVGDGNGFTYTEAGLFVGTPGSGTLFARKIFTGITKSIAFELKVTWYITVLVNDLGGACSGVSLIGPSSATQRVTITAAGGEKSVTPTFDFGVGTGALLVFLNNALMKPGDEYVEVVSGSLIPPTAGIPTNKGINLVGFTADPGDKFHFYLLSLT